MWKSISVLSNGMLYQGDRLRIQVAPKNITEDQFIDYMLFNDFSGAKGLSLIRLTGFSAGHVSVTLPADSTLKGHNGTSVDWIKSNWKKWIPVEGKPLCLWVNEKLPRARKPTVKSKEEAEEGKGDTSI
jgi:Immunity protein 45